MLSYRHAFHAGNHADVLKHSTLTLLTESFKRKDKPFIYIDTHAGAGLYDLQGKWADKTGEYKWGIARLWEQQAIWHELAEYFRAIHAHNPDGALRYYPGSPEIVSQLLRAQDKQVLCELHNNEVELLKAHFRGDNRTAIHHRDGFEALPALLPPTPRRGLVLIDPPYEQKEDYRHVVEVVQKAYKRWATGTYVIWYPLLAKRRDHSQTMLKKLAQLEVKDLLVAELEVEAQQVEMGMHGSGMAIINPPWQLDIQLKKLLPRFNNVLALTEESKWRVEWLKGGA
ncbi:MAG: 23S rRNA (adenine(2030)-N(6))-methyltransferase RlmJ [Thiolinea sp.]